MRAKHTTRTLPLATVIAVAVAMLTGAVSAQAAVPIKEIPASHFGREVNLTEAGKGPLLEDVCSVESGDTCRPGSESSIAGGFSHPQGVAVGPDGNVYVADTNDERVQQLTATGVFVSMFGWDVNETKEKEGAPQPERNVCTALSGDVCRAGVSGGLAGQFSDDYSIAVDQTSGDVYVQDLSNWRVEVFTSGGELLWMVGRGVDETTGGNLCTVASHDVCGPGTKDAVGVAEAGAFSFAQGFGDLLAVGGPGDLLYVGDEHRVQEFSASTGAYVGEISLTSISSEPESKVVALAVDNEPASPEYGDVYLVYGVPVIGEGVISNVVRKFTPGGVEVKDGHFPLTLSPRDTNATEIVKIKGIALDSAGRLAVSETERFQNERFEEVTEPFGSLLEGATGHLITEFAVPPGFGVGVTFGTGIDPALYAANPEVAAGDLQQEVVAYAPVDVAELLAGVAPCSAGAERESDATFDCTLNGEANSEGVSETVAWFQWGKSASLGSETAKHPVVTGSVLEPVPSATIAGVAPNQSVYYRLAGEDHNVKAPEQPLSSETMSVLTPTVPAKIVGTPSAQFVQSFSAVLFAELNPEHASTTYEFQYGPCENLDTCPQRGETGALESAVYAKIGTTLEAGGLVPGTVYHYRLVAENDHHEKTTGPEATFTTAPAPVPAAATGTPSAIGATSATVSGTVNPDGQPATYAFELGVYEGAGTQYGVVFSGPAGTGTTPLAQSLGLTGLQPGTTYAYRITVKSGYGTATGETVLFTTTGLPSILEVPSPLPLLAMPSIAFPSPAIPPKPKAVVKKKAKKAKPKKKQKKSKAKKSAAHKTSKQK